MKDSNPNEEKDDLRSVQSKLGRFMVELKCRRLQNKRKRLEKEGKLLNNRALGGSLQCNMEWRQLLEIRNENTMPSQWKGILRIHYEDFFQNSNIQDF